LNNDEPKTQELNALEEATEMYLANFFFDEFDEGTVCFRRAITFEAGAYDQYSGIVTLPAHGADFCEINSQYGCGSPGQPFVSRRSATEFKRSLYASLRIPTNPG